MKIKIKDIDIYYEVYGEGKPIFMIHGLSPDHRLMKGAFEPVLEKSSYRRIYFDFPGMGKSGMKDEYYSSDVILEIIMSFKTAIIGDSNYLLAAESYGGYLSHGLIVKEADKIDGLFLICPATQNERETRELPEFKIVEKDREYASSFNDETEEWLDSVSVIQTKYTIDRTREEVFSGIHLSKNFDYEKLEKNRRFSFPIDEYVFEKPCVILTGLFDHIVGYKDQFSILKQFKDVSYAVIADTGHNMQIEDPDIFNAFLNSWIKRVDKKTK